MWLRILVTILLFLIVLPIFLLIPVSFNGGASFNFPPEGFSLKWYKELYIDPQWFDVIKRSFLVGILTAIVSTILGLMAAVAENEIDFPGKKIFTNLIMAPMTIPTIVVAIALFFSFTSYKLTDSIIGLVLGHSVLAIPFVYITVSASLKGLDKNLLMAAQSLGSTPIGAFFKITVPNIRSAIMAGFIFGFVISFDEVVISIFLTGPTTKTLPILMWENFTLLITPTAAAISTILIIGIVVLFLIFPKLIQLNVNKTEK